MTAAIAPTDTDASPNHIAESLTGRDYLSWSQINSFRSCPRAHKYRYRDALRPAFVSSNLLFGSGVHAAAQAYFEAPFEGSTTSLDDLVEAYRDEWRERVEDLEGVPIRFGKNEDAETLANKARDMLEAFMASPLAESQGDLIAVEEKFTGTIAEDLPDLLAIVDLIWMNDTGLHILDFKTSRSKWTDLKVAEASHQLQLYANLARSMIDPDVDVHLHFGVLVKTKSPSVQSFDAAMPADPDSLANLIRPVWCAMQLGIDYGNPSAGSCAGCPYRNRCPDVTT